MQQGSRLGLHGELGVFEHAADVGKRRRAGSGLVRGCELRRSLSMISPCGARTRGADTGESFFGTFRPVRVVGPW
jgi:hypothetical protein